MKTKCAPCLHSSSMPSCICFWPSLVTILWSVWERPAWERPLHLYFPPLNFIVIAPFLDSYSPCFQWSTAVLWIKAVHIQWWVIRLSLATREVLKKGHGRAWKSTLSFLRLNRKAGMVVEQASALLSNYLSNCCSSAKPWGVRTSKVILYCFEWLADIFVPPSYGPRSNLLNIFNT